MSAALTTARASMIMPKVNKSELDDLPMASAKPSAIREAAKQKRLASQAERSKMKERQRRDAEQQMKMQRYRDEIAAIKAKQNAGDEPEVKKTRASEIAKDVADKVISKHVTAKRESAVLGYSTSDLTDVCSDDEFSLDNVSLDEDFASKKKKFAEMASPKSKGQRVVREMNKSFRKLDLSKAKKAPITKTKADEESKESETRLPLSISAMAVSQQPPRQREYRNEVNARVRRAPTRTSSGRISDMNRKAPARTSSNLVPEMRRRPMQRDLLFDDEQVKLAAERGNARAYRGTTSDYRRGSMGALNTKRLSDKQKKEKDAILEQRQKLEEAQIAFEKGHNLCWEIHDSANACKTLFVFAKHTVKLKSHLNFCCWYQYSGRVSQGIVYSRILAGKIP